MEYLFIYLLQLTNMIEALMKASFITFFIIIAVNFVLDFASEFEVDFAKGVFNISKKYIKITLIISILCAMIPTKQTLLLLGSTYLGKKAINEVVTSQKLEKINTIIDLQLDKYIKELKVEVN